MKKRNQIFARILILCVSLCLFSPLTASANMAAPAEPDIASAVTFEQNDSIAVLSEVLDITVKGSQATIRALYRMKNTTDTPVSTPAMFLAPGMEEGNTAVTVDGTPAAFDTRRYTVVPGDDEVTVSDWRYAVLHNQEAEEHGTGYQVDTVSFRMDFNPGEEYDVSVTYLYRLGGYPDRDDRYKCGSLVYYLTPAALWRDFSDLTVNLHLDSGLPVLSDSNLPFEKVGERSWQYRSDTLPREDLRITLDQNGWQNFVGMFRGPYGTTNVILFAVLAGLILAGAGVTAAVLLRARARKRRMRS